MESSTYQFWWRVENTIGPGNDCVGKCGEYHSNVECLEQYLIANLTIVVVKPLGRQDVSCHICDLMYIEFGYCRCFMSMVICDCLFSYMHKYGRDMR